MIKNDIKAIDKTTVHRICSGQVVLSLAIAVKELVENSLDAGATSVEIKLKEYGSDSIEVVDNGQGVRPENFRGLALKHHTSKIRDFSDLVGVDTFGFRGEALSSLCALSDLTVITRHADQNCATTLVFDSNGVLTQETSCSRQVGTTVILSRLFHSLPVRQKEFHKNLKREFNKMIQLLYAYCLISTNVKILCTNQTAKGSRTTLIATQGCATIRENISCVFSSKQLNGLLSIETTLPDENILSEMKFNEDDCSIFKLDGYISSCSHGSGRSTTDRQFFYINSRPCEPSKVIKAINETYHHFNPNQYPFVFLNVEIKRDLVDVNVTPDKRQVFMDREKLLVAIIKSSLEKTFEKIPSTFVMNNVVEKKEEKSENLGLFDRWRHKNDSKRTLEDTNPKSPKIPKIQKTSQPLLNSFLTVRNHEEKDKNLEILEENFLCNDPEEKKEEETVSEEENLLKTIKFEEIKVPNIKENQEENEISQENHEIQEIEAKPVVYDTFIERGKKCVGMKVDIKKIRNRKTFADSKTLNSVKFRAAINQNVQAEEELKKEISKEMFEKMEILGQFNLGFIVAKLGPDLFIIDQHASDEKFNFETLQKTTVITNQKLVVPEPLSLTAANESVLMDNLDIFKKNGFEFKIDENAPPTKRIFLTAKPLSKNWLFGKEDIDELIFMLQDSPNTNCRPSRVRAMFASRACRKSVMIGTALNFKEMKKLVVQMGTIEHPWNCPHGRPTMRHLVNLDLLDD